MTSMTRKIILTSVLGAVLSGCLGGGDSGSSGGSIMRTVSQALSNIGQLRLKPGNFSGQSSTAISEAASFTANFADRTPDQLTTNLEAFHAELRATTPRDFNPETDVVQFFGGNLGVKTSELPSSTHLSYFIFGNTSMNPGYTDGTADEAGMIAVELSDIPLSIGTLIAQSKDGKTSSINISTTSSLPRSFKWDTALLENTNITFGHNTYLEMARDSKNPIAISTTALGKGIISHTHSDLKIPEKFTLMLKSTTSKLDLGANKLTNQGTLILTDGTIKASSVECKPDRDYLTKPFLAAVQSSVQLKENFLELTTEWQSVRELPFTEDVAFEGFFFMSGGNVTGTLTGNRFSFLFGGKLDQSFTNNGLVFMSNSTSAMKTALLNQLPTPSPTDDKYQLVSVVKEVVGLMGDSTPNLQATTNNGIFLMSGGQINGTFINNGIMEVHGGRFSEKLINNGTLIVTGKDNGLESIQKLVGSIPEELKPLIQAFLPKDDPVFKDITNSGTLTVDGGQFGHIHNKDDSVFIFGGAHLYRLSSDNASTGNLTFENGSRATLVTGHTLKTGSINVTGSPTLKVMVMNNQTTPILDASGAIDLGNASIEIIPLRAIKSGTVITLAKTTGTLTFSKALNDSNFNLSNARGALTLTALQDIAAQATAVTTVSKTISAGRFRSHKAGKLVGAKEASFAGATFAVAGSLNVSNGFNANNAQVQMNLGKTTFESNFTKTAGMDLTGTFNVFNSIDVAGFTLTNSASFATKNDSNVARFNEMGFMTGVSKKLRSNGFELTPSVSVGFAKLSDVSAYVDGYSITGASAGAYLADLSLDAGHAFKVAGLEMNLSGELSFGVKSAQSFELHNAFGQIMTGTTANKNLGLSFGFTAKLDNKTSFYANAKTGSYNNAKALEVGFKF